MALFKIKDKKYNVRIKKLVWVWETILIGEKEVKISLRRKKKIQCNNSTPLQVGFFFH